MTTKKRMDKLVPYSVIDAAVQGDADAVSRIVDHYSGYIAAYVQKSTAVSHLHALFEPPCRSF